MKRLVYLVTVAVEPHNLLKEEEEETIPQLEKEEEEEEALHHIEEEEEDTLHCHRHVSGVYVATCCPFSKILSDNLDTCTSFLVGCRMSNERMVSVVILLYTF